MTGRHHFLPDLEDEIAKALQDYAALPNVAAIQRLQVASDRVARFAKQNCMPLETIVAELQLIHHDIPDGDDPMERQMNIAFDRLLAGSVLSFFDAPKPMPGK